MLGELLYPKVLEHSTPELAPKITGMLIDLSVMPAKEIVQNLMNEEQLQLKIKEAGITISTVADDFF